MAPIMQGGGILMRPESLEETIELFVPGRLCLLGEHSDWASYYRNINADIIPGRALVTGIEQGIYARIRKSDRFVMYSNLESYKGQRFECEMDMEKLLAAAGEGGFFSYVAGVASYIKEHYNVGGIEVEITDMDLPIKSGLSSSAAICVLVARAFNQLYKLNLSTVGEMRVAYLGEMRTPSRCGRLDQACAYGTNPVVMQFDGADIRVKPLQIKKPLYYVIADLMAGKDTVKILADLNKCYPFAASPIDRTVQEALGADNEKYVMKAVELIESGKVEELGALMEDYQRNFDLKVAPACPEQLTAPVLHSVFADEGIREFVFGMKGVGSQGDGTVQFLCKDEESQERLIAYLKEKRGMEGVALTLRPHNKIKKAVIPVAGFGTRVFPATKVVKKDFLPVLDTDGNLKPMLLILLEQLVEAGITEICLIIGEEEHAIYEQFFTPVTPENYIKLPEGKKRIEDTICRIARHVKFVYQTERKGFGHAVYQSRDFADGDPVLLLLGDMIYHSNREENCMKQMMNVYDHCGKPVVSLHTVALEDVPHYGILHGAWENESETIMHVDAICEKPDVAYASEFLATENRNSKENYYAVFGQYVLTDTVYEVLHEHVMNDVYENGEIQLTGALEEARRRGGLFGYVVDGTSYDLGLPEKYIETISQYYKKEQ